MNEEMLQKVRELLGASDDLTEENVLSRITEKIQSLTSKAEELQKENIDLKAKSESNSSTASKIDKNLAEQMGTTAEQQLSLLVDAGKITPAVKNKLTEALIGKTGSRNIMALSIGDNNAPSLLSKVIDALKENDIVQLGERTGVQVLSRSVPGAIDKETSEKEQAKVTDEMVEMVNGKSN